MDELKAAWSAVSGQLTTSLFGTGEDFAAHAHLLELAESVAGRIVFNGVPTGVEVCPSMVHGGPYPSTTDSRFTAVGINAVKRWVRPVCFQNCPENLLPEELRNRNGRNIWRFINNEWTRNDV
jgi:NADP-dependent aldehyde dehydrogenase